jgi:ascorbate-specific PTS system EIIC-type component UlaA
MRLLGLMEFITVMWLMILTAAAILIIFVAPIDSIVLRMTSNNDRWIISIIQASVTMAIIVILVLALNKMKKAYLQKRIRL